VVVCVAIASSGDAAETPAIGLTDKARELGVLEILWNYTDLFIGKEKGVLS